MLAYRFRFHGHRSLNFLYRQGKTYRVRSLSARVVKNPRRTDSRFGVIVTKKVIKSAPKRNRIRRRVYEIVRTHWDELHTGYDVVIMIYDPECAIMPYEQLVPMVLDLLGQAGLLRHNHSDKRAGLLPRL